MEIHITAITLNEGYTQSCVHQSLEVTMNYYAKVWKSIYFIILIEEKL